MRTLSTGSAIASCLALGAVCVAACGPRNQDNAQPNAAATATGYPGYPQQQPYPAQGYPPPQQGQYPQPAPTYGQQPYPAAPPTAQPLPAPAPAPAGSGQMAVPGPIAFQCQNDVPCGTHHCNLQYGKCAFPCQSAVDCIAPNQCLAGFCAPVPPQQTTH